MSGRQGQTVQNWLMMIPLCVVPLVAVFGVPKFDLLTSSNADGQEPELELELGDGAALPPMPSGQIQTNVPAGSAESHPSRAAQEQARDSQARTGWNDPFEDPQAEHVGHSTENLSPRPPENAAAAFVDPFETWGADTSNEMSSEPNISTEPSNEPEGYQRETETVGDAKSKMGNPSETAAMLKWREAVARLNQLGVQKFELSSTEEPKMFRFACDLISTESSRVAHRFQAEAGDPLQAVAHVIQQVETWTAQHKLR